MSTEETGRPDLPTRYLTEFGLRRPSFAERLWYRKYFGNVQDAFGVFDVDPVISVDPVLSKERTIGELLSQDPLWGAIESRARERANTAAQLVTQGTLAYVHAEDAPYRVERYIPVELYLSEPDSKSLLELTAALRELFELLGFEYIGYPAVAFSSVHGRGSLKTRPMTIEELGKAESLIASGLELDGVRETNAALPDSSIVDKVKSLLELRKLQAEIDLADQEKRKSKAETEKADAERAAAVMDKRSKFASLMLKLAALGVAVTVGIGTWVAESSPATEPIKPEQPAQSQTVHSHTAERSSHLKAFGKFVEKLAEQAETGED